jgi:hypothetical protein
VCAFCPLGKLKKNKHGNWLSCIEAVGVENLTEEEANAKYKDVAARLLLDEAIDDILGADDGSK